MNRVRRIAVTVVISAIIFVAGAGPALAHSVAGAGGTNYRTTLKRIDNPLPGVRFTVVEAGSRVELRYSGTKPIYVLGYIEDRYLRIDKRGVFENLDSPAAYINKTRDGEVPPTSADGKGTPAWRKLSSETVARWHDHRVHHMGDVDPPQVRRAPDQQHVIVDDWKIAITDGTKTMVARGDLVWVPGPNPVPWFALAAALFLGMIALSRLASPFVPIAIAGCALIAIDVVHSYAIGFANAGTLVTKFGQTFASSIVSIPGWLVGAGGVWLLFRRRVDGFFALVFTGLIAAIVGGLADLNNLSKSQVAFALPMASSRPIVAASLGLGFGIAAASALAIRRLEPSKPSAAEVGDDDVAGDRGVDPVLEAPVGPAVTDD